MTYFRGESALDSDGSKLSDSICLYPLPVMVGGFTMGVPDELRALFRDGRFAEIAKLRRPIAVPKASLLISKSKDEIKMYEPKMQRRVNTLELPSEPGVFIVVFRMRNRSRPVWASVGAKSSREARTYAQECRELWQLETILMAYDSTGPVPEPVYWMPNWSDVLISDEQ